MKLINVEGGIMKISNGNFKRALQWRINNPDGSLMWEQDFGAKYIGESHRVTDLDVDEAKDLLKWEFKTKTNTNKEA